MAACVGRRGRGEEIKQISGAKMECLPLTVLERAFQISAASQLVLILFPKNSGTAQKAERGFYKGDIEEAVLPLYQRWGSGLSAFQGRVGFRGGPRLLVQGMERRHSLRLWSSAGDFRRV